MFYSKERINREEQKEVRVSRLERFESIVGTVTGCDKNGCYIADDETGKIIYFFGNGNKGDRVRIGVSRVHPVTGRIYWVLESVLEYGDFCA